ncbi:MAG: YwaF family protein [Clostridia bacterium]|nr:YwaF family protein [Clostridia bacterium]
MFSLNHIILLIVCAVTVAVSVLITTKLKLSSRKVSVIFFVICCISEIIKDFSNIIPSRFGGFVLDPFDIPLHLCSLVIFAMLYIVVTKNDKSREHIKTAVVVVGLIAPVFALLIPSEGVNLNKAITYQYFGYHAALFWYSLHLVLTKQVTFGLKEYIRNLKYLVITVMALLYLNSALSAYGVNYCFLREPPIDGLPILNLNHGWLVYFITLLLIGVISVTIVHLPSLIKEIINNKK